MKSVIKIISVIMKIIINIIMAIIWNNERKCKMK